MQRRSALKFLALGTAGLGLAACAGVSGPASGVLAIARNNGLDTFLRAVDAADLTERLSDEGPYTLFAPSERAFQALPAGRLNDLLRPANQTELRRLVSYHVVTGMLMTDFLAGRDINFTTLAGTPLNIDATSGAARVNGTAISRANLEAANGVVHIIDRVLTPR